MLIGTLATTGGVLAARFAQNFSAMKLEKGKSPADAKAQAGKPLYIGIGALVPTALGFALAKFAKQPKIGNALMMGGLAFGIGELARQFVFSKAKPESPLFALGEDNLGAELSQGEDGTEWVNLPGRGYHQIVNAEAFPKRRQRAITRGELSGIAARDDLGGISARDDLGGIAARDDLGGISARDDLGDDDGVGSYSDPGRDFAGGDEYGMGDDAELGDDDMGSYADPGRDLGALSYSVDE